MVPHSYIHGGQSACRDIAGVLHPFLPERAPLLHIKNLQTITNQHSGKTKLEAHVAGDGLLLDLDIVRFQTAVNRDRYR